MENFTEKLNEYRAFEDFVKLRVTEYLKALDAWPAANDPQVLAGSVATSNGGKPTAGLTWSDYRVTLKLRHGNLFTDKLFAVPYSIFTMSSDSFSWFIQKLVKYRFDQLADDKKAAKLQELTDRLVDTVAEAESLKRHIARLQK